MRIQKSFTALFLGALVFAARAQADVVAYYKFDESSGTTAAPTVGSINGTILGSGSFVSGGISGNAVSLNTSGDGVVSMGNNFPFLTGDFSISFWLKTTTTEADSIAVSKHAAGSQNGYLFPVGPTGGGGSPNKANFTASTVTSQGVTSSTTVNDGAWHQVVGVYKSGGNASIYVDGAPVEETKTSSAMVANTAAFYVGGVGAIGNPTVADGRYTGLLDDLQIYNQSLTDSEINFLFANPGQVVPEPAIGATGFLLTALLRRKRSMA